MTSGEPAPQPTEAELEAMYALAIAAAEFHPDGVVTVDSQGLVDFVNTRAEKVTGIRRDELQGRHFTEALPFRDMQGRVWWDFADPWSTLKIVTGHRERMLLLPNGCMVLLTAQYMRNPDGSILALILSLRDAAGRVRAERATAELLTTVAHELRSPIAGVTGFTDSLLQHWDRFEDEDRRTMLRTIKGDAERVSRLVSELLEVSRLDAHSLRIRPRPFDIVTALTTQVTRRVASGEEEERFVVDVDVELPEVWADPDRLEQVITNLVDNALRHGSGRVFLEASAAHTPAGEAGIRIRICDEGEGIPEQERELVFSRRWRGGSKSGTGLGLFLVRGLVHAHGGTVRLGDRPGGGLMVEVLLPAQATLASETWVPSLPHD